MSGIEQSIELLLEETKPVIEHTFIITRKIFDEYQKETGKKAKIDAESFVDVCSHLAIIYHLLVVSVAEAILTGKDINRATQKTLKIIQQLSSDNKEFISPVSEAKARKFVDNFFSKTIGTA